MKAPRSATALSAARAALRAKAARFAIAASVAAFFALEAPAMVLYHGGTGWDREARARLQLLGQLSVRSPAARGDRRRAQCRRGDPGGGSDDLAPRGTGAVLAGASAPPRRSLADRAAGARPRPALGGGRRGRRAASERSLRRDPRARGRRTAAAVPGLLASFLATVRWAWRAPRGRAPRVAAAVGAAWLGFAAVDFVFYARHLAAGNEGSPLLPAAQKVALVCLMAWMLAVAAPARRRLVRGRSPCSGACTG